MAETLLGSKVGHFRIVDKIATGGMGEVYAGYDETLQRKVALKRIRPEYHLDGEAKGRFLREARVLSQLGHPNICLIYDYLEGDKSDFIVMELVEGRSLTQAMKKGLDGRAKIRIAEQVASVLVAAHDKGVIHRDLKPDNVMLAEGEQVKVLDFGLSRRLDEEVTAGLEEDAQSAPPSMGALAPEGDLTHGLAEGSGSSPESRSGGSLTTIGAIVGTLGYMSPEQARGEQATAASDMYSFGLVLQELFTGKPSYEPGLKPQARLEMAKRGETLPVAGVDSDLAALVGRLKSLEPAARPSAVDAADKLAWIRRKPNRRRARLLVAAAITVLALFGAAMTVQSIRASRAEKRARDEAETAKQVSGFLVDLFKVSDPGESRGSTITAREILDRGSKKIGTDLKDQPLVQARLQSTMGAVYINLGLYKEAEPLLSSALATREKTLGLDNPSVADDLNDMANLYCCQGRYAEAEPFCRQALAIQERAFGRGRPERAESLNNLAAICTMQHKYDDAEPLYKEALAIKEKALGPDDPKVAISLGNLVSLYLSQSRYAEAEPLIKRALAIDEKALGPDHPTVALDLHFLAGLYQNEGRDAEAEPLYRRILAIREKALGPDHPQVADTLSDLGALYYWQHRYAEAEPLLKRALAIREKALSPDHPDVATTLVRLANLCRAQKRYAEAEPLLELALAVREKAFGPDDPDVADSLSNMALLYSDQGRYPEAEALLQRALTIQEKAKGPRSKATANALEALARCEFKEKRFGDALGYSAHCLEIRRELAAKTPKIPKLSVLVGSVLLLKGQIETAMGKGGDGQFSWKEALAIIEPVAKSAQAVNDQAIYAQILLCLGRTEEARPIVKKLTDGGYTNPDLLALCREKGLIPKDGPTGTQR